MARRPELTDLLPLGNKAFHILLALAEGERHGYSLAKEIEDATDGSIRLGPGTLYGLLKQMLADGWISDVAARDDDDPRRRYYRLTPTGRALARAEAERLATLVRTARARRLLPADGAV
jgi:DNA-binding PadR family transcriptional regulator